MLHLAVCNGVAQYPLYSVVGGLHARILYKCVLFVKGDLILYILIGVLEFMA